MSSRYWSGSIGTVSLIETGGQIAGFELIGAGAFLPTSKGYSNWTGNTRPGMFGNPHTQYSLIDKGRTLEVKFLHIPQTLANQLINLLAPLIPSGAGVTCALSDGFQAISRTFKPNVPNWIDRGEPDGDYIKDFVIRIIEKGA